MGVEQHNYKVPIVQILAPGLLIIALVDAVPGLAQGILKKGGRDNVHKIK
jgi:hypothetical protein